MKNVIMILVAVLGLSLASCQREKMQGDIRVELTDAPGDFQAVYVDVRGLEIYYNGNGGGPLGWVTLAPQAAVYDLLLLQNDVRVVIAPNQAVPVGEITEIRLLLGPDNSVMVDSMVHPLKVPSGEESGLKIKTHQLITANGLTYIVLDFDAAESVRINGNGEYRLHPVIRIK